MEHGLNWRYATKKFDNTKVIPETTFNDLLDVLRLSPSSFGLQPWKFVVIKDQSLRKELRKYAWDQPQITEASHLIVLCAKTGMDEDYVKDFILRTAQSRGIPAVDLGGYQDMILGFVKSLNEDNLAHWMARQVYIALGVLLAESAHHRIDSCPMEGFDAVKFDEILNLKDAGLHAIVLCGLGYRTADDPYAKLAKIRFEANEILIIK